VQHDQQVKNLNAQLAKTMDEGRSQSGHSIPTLTVYVVALRILKHYVLSKVELTMIELKFNFWHFHKQGKTVKSSGSQQSKQTESQELKQAERRMKLLAKEQKMKVQIAKHDSATRVLKSLFKPDPQFSIGATFVWWTTLTKQRREVRAQGRALGLLGQHFKTQAPRGPCVNTWAKEMWKERLFRIQQLIGIKLLNKIKHRLLMSYAHECIKIWDKRHDNDILRKNASLSAIGRIMKFQDLQSLQNLKTRWRKKQTDYNTGLTMAKNIVVGFARLQNKVLKSVLSNWAAKKKISLSQVKNKSKIDQANGDFDQKSREIKAEVQKMMDKSKKKQRKLEKTVQELQLQQSDSLRENGDLRRQLARR